MADIYDFIKELAKIDIEFQDDKNKFHSLKSYIKSLGDDHILIEPPCYNGMTYHLSVGQEISIGIHADDGVYLGESKVIGHELSTISGVIISYPLRTQHVQRREYLRVPMNLETEIIVYEDRHATKKRIIKTRLRDISGSGFSFISYDSLSSYCDIVCKIYLNDSNKEPVISKCDHIYSKQAVIHDEAKYIHAFIFSDISKRDVERIVKASFKYQVELRKKGFALE